MQETGGERILGVFDMRGFSPANVDPGFIKFIIDLLFVYYPKRVGQVLFVDAPFVFRPVWSAISPSLGKYAKLVEFISAKELPAVVGSARIL